MTPPDHVGDDPVPHAGGGAQGLSTARLTGLLNGTYGQTAPVVLAQELRDRLRQHVSSNPFALATDIPTLSIGTSATLTGRIVGPQTGEVTEVGARGVWDTTFGRLPGSAWTGLDFYHTGTTVEIDFFTGTGGAVPIWIFVDGQPIAATQDTTTLSSATSSTRYFLKLTFGASATRRIETFIAHQGAWYSVRAALGDIITPAPRKPVVAFVGDSFWGGSNGSSGFNVSAFLASRYLGVEAFGQGVTLGGTGYIAAGSFTPFGSSARVATAARATPDAIVYQGSVNDDSSFATVQAAAAQCYADHHAAIPNALQIVLGPQPNSATSTISANRQASNAAIRAAAAASLSQNVISFFDQIGNSGAAVAAWNSGTTYNRGDLVTSKGSVWEVNKGTATVLGGTTPDGTQTIWRLKTWGFYGTGVVGGTTGDGTRDTLLYSDAVHPTVLAQVSVFTPHTVRAIRAALDYFALTGQQLIST